MLPAQVMYSLVRIKAFKPKEFQSGFPLFLWSLKMMLLYGFQFMAPAAPGVWLQVIL